ncbi:MAG: ABC transporter permease subunit [Gammaproteobacteria bacterium]|nr:ABC transporter permease subunit [Gammaproteobacteria bacterium]TVQ48956.1 MAG: ABC transporter permease subunit [Gammaproteobacteria bacterium]
MIRGPSPALRAAMVAVLVFLYAPMLLLVIYSFNDSRLVTVWAGFSTRWYGELFRDQQMMSALWVSLRVAVMAASAAVVLGTLAAIALTRLGAFRGRSVLGMLVTAPLLIPEVITGLSLLLLFVAMGQLVGWPAERGMLTVWIAHVTFATAFVTVVVAARLAQFDRALYEAALDLGATPFKAFTQVVLPVIAPALVAGWLLAFTLSLDDLVIASFTSGPGATTLPMVVFSSVRLGVSPKVNALATLLIAFVLLAALVSWWLLRRRSVASAPSSAGDMSRR